jgi:TolB-like protein
VLVVGLTGKAIDQDTADLFCDSLVGELRKRPGLQVSDRADIAAVLGAEREKQLLGCADGQCMAELGGALGAEYIVRGDVGRVGKVLKVHLVMSDAQKGVSAATVSELIKSEANEAFFDKVPKFVDQLLAARK